MAKNIKFNLIIDGNRVSTFEEMQDNLSAELLQHLSTGKLAKWFVSREMVDKAAAVQAIDSTQSDFAQLVALCEVLDLEADEDILAEILAVRELNTGVIVTGEPVVKTMSEIAISNILDADSNLIKYNDIEVCQEFKDILSIFDLPSSLSRISSQKDQRTQYA